MPIWGLSTESDFASPPPGGKAGEPNKAVEMAGEGGDRGKHDSHRWDVTPDRLVCCRMDGRPCQLRTSLAKNTPFVLFS